MKKVLILQAFFDFPLYELSKALYNNEYYGFVQGGVSMYCLRCGNEVKMPNVFCDPCLEDMANCPVRSDAVINLPERPVLTVEKKSRRKKRTDADRVRDLRRWSSFLCMLVLVFSLLSGILIFQMIRMQEKLAKPTEPPKGQNFSTQETTTAPTASVEPSAT